MRGRIAALSAMILVVVAVAVAPATPAFAAAVYISVLNPGSVRPTDAQRFVLGVDGGSTANRAAAILARYNGNLNQFWTVRVIYDDPADQGRDVVQLINAKSGKCLDKSLDAPDANGTKVYQYQCTHTGTPPDNQLWYAWGGGASRGNWRHLASYSYPRCLDIPGPSQINGAKLHMWDCYPTWSQQWNIT